MFDWSVAVVGSRCGQAGGGSVEECGGEPCEVAGGGDGSAGGCVGIHDPRLDRKAALGYAAGDEWVVDLDGGAGHAERLEQPRAHQLRVAQVGRGGDGLTGDGRTQGGVCIPPTTPQGLVPGLLDHLHEVGRQKAPAHRRRPDGATQGDGAELDVSGGVRDELIDRHRTGR